MIDKNLLAAQLQDQGDDEFEALAVLVSREAARRRMRDPVVPIVQVVPVVKTVLQADFLNVVGSPTGGYTEAEITMDADGGIRFYSAAGGGGGGLSDGDYGDIVVSSSGAVIMFSSAVVTTAAKTVLDDTTVAAMVNTLGGATSTGTGGIARATSPAFTTPNIGTPSAGTLTNCTGLPTAGLVNNAVTFAKVVAAGSAGFVGATTAGNYSHRTISNVRSDLSLVPGTDVQAYSDDLQAIADCGPSDGDILYYVSRGGWSALANPGSPSGGTTYVLTHDGTSPAWMEFPLP